jgi:hypothetical protein
MVQVTGVEPGERVIKVGVVLVFTVLLFEHETKARSHGTRECVLWLLNGFLVLTSNF